MKLSVGMITLNEEQFIECSLKSVYSFADEIVIVEGCVTKYSNPIHSIDKTVEIIKTFPDFNKKIKLIQIERYWKNKEEMRNAYLEEMSGDYLLLLDSDECYKEKDLIRLKQLAIERNPICIMYPHIHFWHSFNYYACSREWQGTQLRFSQLKKEYKYNVHYTLSDKKGKNLQWDTFYSKRRLVTKNHISERYPKKQIEESGAIIIPDEISIYHYANLKSKENMRAKVDYYTRRVGKKPNPNKNSGWFDSQWKDEKYLENNSGVKKFEGEHPTAIKERFNL